MVLLDELRVTMSDYRKDLKELYEVLGIEKAQARYDELQKQVADPDFLQRSGEFPEGTPGSKVPGKPHQQV